MNNNEFVDLKKKISSGVKEHSRLEIEIKENLIKLQKMCNHEEVIARRGRDQFFKTFFEESFFALTVV